MDEDEKDLIEESINVPRQYLGTAGEYLTAGKLLLNGFNVFTGAIDDGIDLVALKDDKFYKLQVKTCQDVEGYDSGRFVVGVNLSTLARHNPDTTFVVIVVHYLEERSSIDSAGNHNFYKQDFIVLPMSKIFELAQRKEGRVTITVRSTLVTGNYIDWAYKVKLGKRELVVDEYLFDSFERIGRL